LTNEEKLHLDDKNSENSWKERVKLGFKEISDKPDEVLMNKI